MWTILAPMELHWAHPAGIFSGMFSPQDQDAILRELGDKVLSAIDTAVSKARSDVEAMRIWQPNWFPGMAGRTLANLIHDRIWSHLCDELADDDSVHVLDKEPKREIVVGAAFRFRVKRHSDSDKIRTYPTQGALQFWQQEQPAFPGLEMITLGAGYRWNSDSRSIGPAMVSCRDGLDNPLWSVELNSASGQVASISWTPIDGPDLPTIIDLRIPDDEVGKDSGESG